MNHILNIAELPQQELYSRIFEYFDQTAVNEAVIIKSNYDPKPLYFRFLFERTGQFSWDKTQEADGSYMIAITRIE